MVAAAYRKLKNTRKEKGVRLGTRNKKHFLISISDVSLRDPQRAVSPVGSLHLFLHLFKAYSMNILHCVRRWALRS